MKAKELREMKRDELDQFVRETEKQIFDLRAKRGLSQEATAPTKVRGYKKDLARAKTILREKELASHG